MLALNPMKSSQYLDKGSSEPPLRIVWISEWLDRLHKINPFNIPGSLDLSISSSTLCHKMCDNINFVFHRSPKSLCLIQHSEQRKRKNKKRKLECCSCLSLNIGSRMSGKWINLAGIKIKLLIFLWSSESIHRCIFSDCCKISSFFLCVNLFSSKI